MKVSQTLSSWLGPRSCRWTYPTFLPQAKYNQLCYAEMLGELVTTKTRWLDGGCGHQIADISLEDQASLVNRAELVVGCDLYQSSLELHRTISDRVLCPLDKLPFHDGSFNLITLNMVVEHLEDPELTFRELSRVLDKDGEIVILTPNRRSYFARCNSLANVVLPTKMRLSILRHFFGRESEDVFETKYRANTFSDLRQIVTRYELFPVEQRALRGGAILSFFAPLAIPEMLISRMLFRLGFQDTVCWTLMGVYRKLPHPRAAGRGA